MSAKKCQPSPARYTLPPTVGFNNHDVRKQRMPAFSFGLRTSFKDYVSGPGPNAYGLPSIIGGHDKSKERAPAYSMHGRLFDKDHHVSPAPNAYGLQNFKPGQRSPAYSMGAILKDFNETTEC